MKNPDSDVREHNNDIISNMLRESPVVKEAERKSLLNFIDRYADLGFKNT